MEAAQQTRQAPRTVLITGGTAGIGYHAARLLAGAGHAVIVTGRDVRRGHQAVERIRQQADHGRVSFQQTDHSTVRGNRALARQVRGSYPRLDVLVNNVGGLHGARQLTADGIEATLAMNVVGPFALTIELLPVLEANAPARCVNVVSAAFRMYTGDPFDDVQSERSFVGEDAYSQTKLLNLLVTLAFARHIHPTVVTFNALHPGMAWTEMTRAATPDTLPSFRFVWPILRLVQRLSSPRRAGRRVAFVASSPQLEGVTGAYFERRRAPVRLTSRELDRLTQERAYQLAADLAAGAPTEG